MRRNNSMIKREVCLVDFGEPGVFLVRPLGAR